MAIIATPSRRRLAMAILLAVAAGGALIRLYAPNPSTLRDVGTLLLVMWLPAVGNLVGYLIRKLPRRAPRAAPGFAADAAFVPQLHVRLQAIDLPTPARAALDARTPHCTLLVGQQGFTARMAQPVVQALAGTQQDVVALEFLRPALALRRLPPGTAFHLLLQGTAVATGTVAGAPPTA